MLKKLSDLFHRRVLDTLRFSIQGFLASWKSEEAIRIEILMLPIVIVGALYWGTTRVEQILMISSGLLIIIVELLNTALEKTIDRISTDQHSLSKIVKDIGSAAVLVAIFNFALVWSLILI
jgi:diacylglycerol kinase (ATP)